MAAEGTRAYHTAEDSCRLPPSLCKRAALKGQEHLNFFFKELFPTNLFVCVIRSWEGPLLWGHPPPILIRVEVSPVHMSPLASTRAYGDARVSFLNQTWKEELLHSNNLNPTEGPIPVSLRSFVNICSASVPHNKIILTLI